MPVLYGPTGQAAPSPEIQRRLRAVDPHLALRLNPSGRGWWVVREWGEHEPRREMIQRGEMGPNSAWDLLCEIPLDCGVNDVPGYLERMRRVNGREDVTRLLAELDRYNESLTQDAMSTALAETMNRAELAAERGFGTIPRVYNAGIPVAPPVAPAPSATPPAVRKRRERKRRHA